MRPDDDSHYNCAASGKKKTDGAGGGFEVKYIVKFTQVISEKRKL